MYASARRTLKKGFTLVEILIVVIILGILAAIVIPQFTSASEDARRNSLVSQVQTLRSQIELYKLQHTDSSDLFATDTNATTTWQELTGKTDADGTLNAAGRFGPYLQTVPVNNMTGRSTVHVGTSVSEADAAAATVIDATAGFAYNTSTGKFFALDQNGRVILGGN